MRLPEASLLCKGLATKDINVKKCLSQTEAMLPMKMGYLSSPPLQFNF